MVCKVHSEVQHAVNAQECLSGSVRISETLTGPAEHLGQMHKLAQYTAQMNIRIT